MSKLPNGPWGRMLLGLLGGTLVVLPADATLPAPDDATQRTYLGLAPEARAFTLEDVQARWLVVDVFDMYCHICQQSAPATRRLYDALNDSAEASDTNDIRFLGVGFGNSPLEAATFQRRFKLSFPVVPDRPKHLGHSFAKLRPPTLLVLRRTDRGHEVFIRHQGLLRKKDVQEIAMKLRSAMAAANRPAPLITHP